MIEELRGGGRKEGRNKCSKFELQEAIHGYIELEMGETAGTLPL